MIEQLPSGRVVATRQTTTSIEKRVFSNAEEAQDWLDYDNE